MQTLPSNLLEKLKQAMQTIGNNAQPNMDIIAQKTAKYITEGDRLRPGTVRTGTSLGAIDICIRRENQNAEPTEIVMVYIEDGYAKVATLPYINTPDQQFEYQYTVGPATDVACDFDGVWFRITDRTGIYFDTPTIWSLVTVGDPYVSTVKDGVLTIRQGQGEPLILAEDGVSRCALERGWKNATTWVDDQGLICAYIRNDVVCYRNYCRRDDMVSTAWESEQTLSELPTPVQNVGLIRTNDYRVGFIAESNGTISWALTERSWVGMAIGDERVTSSVSDLSIAVEPINYYTSEPKETLSAGITELSVVLLWGVSPIPQTISNIDAFTIQIVFNHKLLNATDQQAGFTVKDDNNIVFAVSETSLLSAEILILSCNDFNNASGDITVLYSSASASITGEAVPLEDFSISFTPTGLTPTITTPPLPILIYNAE